ncbi:class I SAM-dependent methyltransferase [Paraburkholderia sp.]|jgi:SAM-dependent methyltransferase|uniref:class I SAM-dependent methyltransferase n=1 Tax=Paraburkholderia sp. TaxID=1926495 RepID=UPI002F3EA031
MSSQIDNRFRFSTIAHRDHEYLSPLSSDKALQLIRSLCDGLNNDDIVLDAGCGKAALLRKALELSPCSGVGVDINASFLLGAREEWRGDPGRLRLVESAVLEHPRPHEAYAAVLCVGSVHAFGSFDQCLQICFEWLKPGGRLLIADGYWKQPPRADYLAAIDGTHDEFGTHAQNAERARACGYVVLRTATSSDDEWDEYEGKYSNAMMRYLGDHPDDPEAAAFSARMQNWHMAYLKWGRSTLGFGYYLLMKP